MHRSRRRRRSRGEDGIVEDVCSSSFDSIVIRNHRVSRVSTVRSTYRSNSVLADEIARVFASPLLLYSSERCSRSTGKLRPWASAFFGSYQRFGSRRSWRRMLASCRRRMRVRRSLTTKRTSLELSVAARTKRKPERRERLFLAWNRRQEASSGVTEVRSYEEGTVTWRRWDTLEPARILAKGLWMAQEVARFNEERSSPSRRKDPSCLFKRARTCTRWYQAIHTHCRHDRPAIFPDWGTLMAHLKRSHRVERTGHHTTIILPMEESMSVCIRRSHSQVRHEVLYCVRVRFILSDARA